MRPARRVVGLTIAAVLTATLIASPASAKRRPAADDYDAMARYYRCDEYRQGKRVDGWLYLIKYVPEVYGHARRRDGGRPWNAVADCAR